MHPTFQQTIIAAAAVIGLGGVAIAAPPAVSNPTASRAANPNVSREVAVEQQIADLHTKLLITSGQTKEWDQFAAVMRDNAASMDQTFEVRAAAMASMTASDNMKSYAEIAERHAREMQQLVPAFQALYATMSDGQKKTADQVFRANAARGKQASGG